MTGPPVGPPPMGPGPEGGPVELARPEAWPHRSAPRIWMHEAGSLLGGLMLVSAGLALLSRPGGELAGVFVLALGLFSLGDLVFLPWRLYRRTPGAFPARSTVWEPSGEVGIALAPSPLLRPAVLLSAVPPVLIAAAGIGLFAQLAFLEPSMPATAGEWGRTAVISVLAVGAFLITAAASVYVAVSLVLLLTDRTGARRAGLVLTPSGVRHGLWGLGFDRSWEEIRAVTPELAAGNPVITLEGAPAPRSAGRVRRWLRAFGNTVTIDPALLRCDPLLLYHVLRFYHRNPQARGELGGPEALARIAHRDLPGDESAAPEDSGRSLPHG